MNFRFAEPMHGLQNLWGWKDERFERMWKGFKFENFILHD